MAVDPYGRQPSRDRHARQNLVPQNPRMWEMLVNQAKAKFNVYPSLPASKWIHDEYVKRGGTFVRSKKQDTRHDTKGRRTKQGEREERMKESAADTRQNRPRKNARKRK